MDLVTLRPYLVAALVIVGVIGFWNMQRMKRKKRQEMLLGSSYSQSMSMENDYNTPTSISSELEEKAKNYILQYQSSYPKESVKQGLINLNISDNDAKSLIEKYYNQQEP